ncbi:RidA family protein [uncultured Maribacter sp.]|uniref:RidA family protein n=1 Tax=uncultured Maribacter sp. TaxID=431308 RepID=UPI002637F343|nr:RidA family protein [uncultured Maribacter sp.]
MKNAILLLFFVGVTFSNAQDSSINDLYDYDIEERLNELGIELTEPKEPKTFKISLAVKSGNMLYLSGNLPFSKTKNYKGKLGKDLTVEEGYDAARLVGVNHLSTLKLYLGDLNKVEKIVKVLGMVNSDPNFTDQSKVMNGFSDLMFEVFGERGLHARSAVGMAAIPFNGACEIEMIVQIKEE